MNLYNAASDFVRKLKVYTQLGSLGKIFTKPSSLYVAPAATPSTSPAKRPKAGATENEESENQKNKKLAQQEG
eukprot:5042865-Ditylum_brightwellii.AAC.1